MAFGGGGSQELMRLFVVLAAKTNELDKGLADAQSRVQAAAAKMNRMGTVMTKALTVPLVGLGAAAAKSAVDFESAFAGVRKTVDASEEEFAALRKQILQMSKEVPSSAAAIASVAEAAGQLGIRKEALAGFTRVMIDLGETTNLGATEGAQALARFANIVQMSQQDFDRLGAVIVDLGNNMATTEAEIVAMGLRIAGAGKQIGLTEAQILSFAAALSSVGIEAEAGGSAISRTFVGMAQAVSEGGDKLRVFAAVAGMTAQQFAKAFKEDAAGATTAFVQGLGKISEQGGDLFAVLEALEITEIRQRDALLRAAGAGDLLARSLDIGSAAWQKNTALTEEARKRYETTAAKIAMMRNRLQAAAIELGEKMLPALQKLVEQLGRAADWFANLSPTTQEWIVKLGALAVAMGPVLKLLTGLISLGTTLATVTIPAIGASLGGLLGPIAAAVAALGSLWLAYRQIAGAIEQGQARVANLGRRIRAAEAGVSVDTLDLQDLQRRQKFVTEKIRELNDVIADARKQMEQEPGLAGLHKDFIAQKNKELQQWVRESEENQKKLQELQRAVDAEKALQKSVQQAVQQPGASGGGFQMPNLEEAADKASKAAKKLGRTVREELTDAVEQFGQQQRRLDVSIREGFITLRQYLEGSIAAAQEHFLALSELLAKLPAGHPLEAELQQRLQTIGQQLTGYKSALKDLEAQEEAAASVVAALQESAQAWAQWGASLRKAAESAVQKLGDVRRAIRDVLERVDADRLRVRLDARVQRPEALKQELDTINEALLDLQVMAERGILTDEIAQAIAKLRTERARLAQEWVQVNREALMQLAALPHVFLIFEFARHGSKEFVEETKKGLLDMAEFAKEAARGVQQAFATFFFDAFEGRLRSLADLFRSLFSVLARALANVLGGYLAESLGRSLNIQGFAAGGVVPGLPGEPRLILAHGGERIVPLNGRQPAGEGVSVVVNNNLGVPAAANAFVREDRGAKTLVLELIRRSPGVRSAIKGVR